jgi:hypothetical protein
MNAGNPAVSAGFPFLVIFAVGYPLNFACNTSQPARIGGSKVPHRQETISSSRHRPCKREGLRSEHRALVQRGRSLEI